MDLPRRALSLLWSAQRSGARGRLFVETVGVRMFINLSLESKDQNIANGNVRNPEHPKIRRKPSSRDRERLKTFNAKKAAAQAADENKDNYSEESSEVESVSGTQSVVSDTLRKEKEVPVNHHIENEAVLASTVKDSENNQDRVTPILMETFELEGDFQSDVRTAATRLITDNTGFLNLTNEEVESFVKIVIEFANEDNVKNHILHKESRKWGQKFVVPENDILKTWNSLADMYGERRGGALGKVVSFRKDFKVETLGWLLDRLICVVINKRKINIILK